MKIASRIVLLVGGIIGFLNAALFFIYSIVFIVFSTPALAGVIRENIENGTINVANASDVETALTIVTIIFIVFAVWFFLWGVISLVSAILTFKARQYHEKNKYVVGIVFNLNIIYYIS